MPVLRSLALLFLLLPAVAYGQGSVPPSAAISACDTIKWNLQPMVGIANSSSAILAAVPQSSVTLRARLSTGAYAETRLGVGREAQFGATCATSPCWRTGTWDSMKKVFTATGAAGETAGPNVSVEFSFSGLTPNTRYDWVVEYECNGTWRPDRRFGRGNFRTWPAPGAAVPVRVLFSADTHLTAEYSHWVTEPAASPCADADLDGVCDAYEDYLRGLNTLWWLSRYASDAHLWIAAGDDAFIHTIDGCSGPDVGPCSSPNVLDGWNPLFGDDSLPITPGFLLGRSSGLDLGEGPAGNPGDETFHDDEVDKAEARVGLFANRAWVASHKVASIFHCGNHEACIDWGHEDCSSISTTQWQHLNCDNAAHEAWQQGKISREAYRNYLPNPNELWPSGIDETDDDIEEQGAYHVLDLGRLRIININEYVHTTGVDTDGYLFAAGTTIDPSDCVGVDDPFQGCSTSATTNSTTSQPSTPWEWNIGPQLAWAVSAIQNASNADVIVVHSHHPVGGVGLTELYSYGRMPIAAGARYCQVGGVDATVTRPGFAWLTGSIGDGEKIPCWDGTVGSIDNADQDERICDFLVDGDASDDDGVCGPLVDNTTVWGQEAQIQAALQAACEAGKTAIRAIGHDHLFTVATRGCVKWITLGQAGGAVSAGWAFSGTEAPEFKSWSDSDGDGIPDYAQSAVVEAVEAHGLGLQVPPPFGWDGKGFFILDVDGDGDAHGRFISVPGHEATAGNPNGQVTYDQNL